MNKIGIKILLKRRNKSGPGLAPGLLFQKKKKWKKEKNIPDREH
jgi:hypothetical protein